MAKPATNGFSALDPVLTVPVRLAIVSVLVGMRQADFSFLQDATQTTQGNLSHQLKKLSEAGYIKIIKTTKGAYPQTICTLTVNGHTAFDRYVEAIKKYLHL